MQPKFILIASLASVLAACAFKPSTQLPAAQIPEQLAQLNAEGSDIDWRAQPVSDWWQGFGSVELVQLYSELQNHNLDLQAAQWQLQQSRALLGQQRARNWPHLNAGLSNRHIHNFDTGATGNSNSGSFSASYEVDLWGTRSAANFGAAMLLAGQQQQYRSTQLQLQAQLAQSYINHLALGERLAIARQNLTASEELLQLINLRYEAGSASRIELDQQRNVYLNAQAQLRTLQHNLSDSERALALLLGRESLTAPLNAEFSDLVMPAISAVQPVALLQHRPDVALAETRVGFEEATLHQQRQRRWPQLTISADVGVAELADLSTGWTGGLFEGLTMPLFNAGLIRQQIESAEAGLELALVEYRQSVLLALEDTLQTLKELQYHNDLAQIRAEELANSERLHQVALLRYEAGDTDFLNLLAAQSTWFNARDSFVQSQSNRLLAAVNVFRAMGVAPAERSAN